MLLYVQGRGQPSEQAVKTIFKMLSAGSYTDDGTTASGKHHLGNPLQLFIGGLSHSTTEATLRERVSPLGELTAGVHSAQCLLALCVAVYWLRLSAVVVLPINNIMLELSVNFTKKPLRDSGVL